MTRIRMGLVLGLLLAVGVAVAACGGGGGKGDGVASLGGAGSATSTTRAGAGGDLTRAAVAFARCMRQHGINMPDPQVTGDGGDQQSPTGVRKDDPRATAAEPACAQGGKGGK
jgi:hypothetical protein